MKTKIMLTLLGAAVAFGSAGCPGEGYDAAPETEEPGITIEEEPASEPGSEPGSMPDMDPGSEPGSEPGSDAGLTLDEEDEDPDVEPGSEPGSEAGSMPDMDPGSEPGSDMR